MKNIKRLLYILPLGLFLFTSCSKWTDIDTKEIDHVGGHNTSDSKESAAYYANLREWKKTADNYARPVSFGWFSNWAPSGVVRKGYLSSVPDSLDIISMWSGAPGRYEITDAQKKDKEYVQKVKGIKLLEVSLLSHLGKGRTPDSVYADVEKQAEEEGWSDSQLALARKHARWDFWGFTSHDLNNKENLEGSLATFAKALCDSLFVSDWDGFDIDWEPGAGFNDADGTINRNSFVFLVKEMGKYIVPKSDPEGKGHKLFCIDGEITSLPDELDEYVDYWIRQTYGQSRPSFKAPGNKPEKVIVTENFEASATSGGYLLRQAAAMPSKGYKGGVGAYRFDNDYANSPDYKWMRQAIQINQKVFNEWKAEQEKEDEL